MVRLGAVMLVAGGVCLALFLIIHPYGEVAGATVALKDAWIPAHTFHFLGALFALFGLTAFYARHYLRLKVVGFVAFVLAFTGTAMFVGTGMITAALWPRIAESDPSFVAEDGPMFTDTLTNGATTVTYGFMVAGYVLLAAVLWRKNVTPWPISLALAIGILLFSAPVDPVGPAPWAFRLSGAVIFGAALAAMGYLLWNDAPEAQPAAVPARAT